MQKKRKEKAKPLLTSILVHGGHPLRISASLNRQRLPGPRSRSSRLNRSPLISPLQVDGRVLAEVVNEANNQSATRGPQGGPH
jgi:hypothetical protein